MSSSDFCSTHDRCTCVFWRLKQIIVKKKRWSDLYADAPSLKSFYSKRNGLNSSYLLYMIYISMGGKSNQSYYTCAQSQKWTNLRANCTNMKDVCLCVMPEHWYRRPAYHLWSNNYDWNKTFKPVQMACRVVI